jgi:hypothetical protein
MEIWRDSLPRWHPCGIIEKWQIRSLTLRLRSGVLPTVSQASDGAAYVQCTSIDWTCGDTRDTNGHQIGVR